MRLRLRRKPDYADIANLERELGIGQIELPSAVPPLRALSIRVGEKYVIEEVPRVNYTQAATAYYASAGPMPMLDKPRLLGANGKPLPRGR